MYDPRKLTQPCVTQGTGGYGQHLTKAQVDALSAPHPDSTGLVEDWLSHHGILHNPECQMTRSSSGDWTLVSISVGQGRMLEVKYNVYKHSATGATLIRATSCSLPRILHDHVVVVTPATYFGQLKLQHKFMRSAGRFFHERGDGSSVSLSSSMKNQNISPTDYVATDDAWRVKTRIFVSRIYLDATGTIVKLIRVYT